jgi:hypothetical protein
METSGVRSHYEIYGQTNDPMTRLEVKLPLPDNYQEHPKVTIALNELFEYYKNFDTNYQDLEGEITWEQARDLSADRKLTYILKGHGDLFIHRVISWNQKPGGKYLAKKMFDYQLSEGHFTFSLYIVEELLKAGETELKTYYTSKARTILTKKYYKTVFRYFSDKFNVYRGILKPWRLDL